MSVSGRPVGGAPTAWEETRVASATAQAPTHPRTPRSRQYVQYSLSGSPSLTHTQSKQPRGVPSAIRAPHAKERMRGSQPAGTRQRGHCAPHRRTPLLRLLLLDRTTTKCSGMRASDFASIGRVEAADASAPHDAAGFSSWFQRSSVKLSPQGSATVIGNCSAKSCDTSEGAAKTSSCMSLSKTATSSLRGTRSAAARNEWWVTKPAASRSSGCASPATSLHAGACSDCDNRELTSGLNCRPQSAARHRYARIAAASRTKCSVDAGVAWWRYLQGAASGAGGDPESALAPALLGSWYRCACAAFRAAASTNTGAGVGALRAS